jgi:hypothetical protein
VNPTARLRQIELNIAVRIGDRDLPRAIARHWSHNGPRAAWVPLGALPILPFVPSGGLAPMLLLGILNLLVLAAERLADRTHETGWIDRVHPCPLCPHWEEGDDGRGGGWNGDDFPSAPPPMDDFDDDRVRAMAGDLDAQLAALVQEARR